MLDAPVSGGVGGAEAGTLTFMVGGAEASAVARGEPLMAAMGRNIVHAGGPGNGQAAKMCNNMILGVSMIAVSEAFALAERVGLDAQTLFDIVSTASGQCWSLTSYCPVPGPVPSSPANRDYRAGFTAAMMLKDLRLARGAAQANGANTPLGSHAASRSTSSTARTAEEALGFLGHRPHAAGRGVASPPRRGRTRSGHPRRRPLARDARKKSGHDVVGPYRGAAG